jgi:pyruvate/2-oxoglutarate dehydrogenase complex dihydrolipoamide acyltransferase (E2) component
MTGSSDFTTDATGVVKKIFVPREIVNADSVYFISWLVLDGTFVEDGVGVCEIETSKAVLTVAAESRGYLRHRARAGEEVPVGGVLGYIADQEDGPLPVASQSDSPKSSGVKISAKAKQKILELGLDEVVFAGRAFVRERDVLEIAGTLQSQTKVDEDPRGPFHIEPLTSIQRRVARNMEESVAKIPIAYLERDIDFAALRKRTQEVMARSKGLVTAGDLLVAAVAKAASQFPRFNSFLTRDDQLHLFDEVNVGVAVDVEADLYVVVVKNAAAKSVTEISKELRMLQYLALRRQLAIDQLNGGTITVTSMVGRGVQHFHPIPYPQQAAVLGITSAELDSNRAMLTLGFDHRIANGSEAAAFLAVVAEELQRV